MKFKKKPIVVAAVRWTGGDPNKELTAFVSSSNGKISFYHDYIMIKTLEGDMKAIPGDWIIKGIKDEFYPCKPDIFCRIYESAEDERISPEPTKNLSFSMAIKYLKTGKNLCRAGWYGKHHINIIENAEYPATGLGGAISPFIAIYPQSGGCIPWLASQADMLADDWMIVE